MSPRVSVIVPLFNKAAFVRRALDSIAAQIYRDFEVIVVDDGSTDDGARIALDYPDPAFRTIQQPNAGPGAARNRGLAEAQGELVAFLDADDRWLPAYLGKAVAALDRWGPDVASVSSCWQEEPDLRHIPALWKERGVPEGPVRLTASTPPAHAVHLLAFMHPCCTIARRELLCRWGGFFGRDRRLYAEDAFLWLKFLLNHSVAFQSDTLAVIDIDASALSHHVRGKRALEPFLEFPEELQAACPTFLRSLLDNILSIRAFKTACVWGSTGYWHDAYLLRKRFQRRGSWKLPYYWPSLLCATPVGSAAGAMRRSFK